MPRPPLALFALALALSLPLFGAAHAAAAPAGGVKNASAAARLIKAGLAAEFMEPTGHGAANPLVESKSPHVPQNRRVEVAVR